MKNENKQKVQASNLLSFLISIIFVIFIIDLSSALPVLLSDQGTDAKNNGTTITTGNITIFIYDNATAGTVVYNQTFVNNITNGSWNIMINPDLEFGRNYWKDYSINAQDLDFDGIERLEFNSPLGLINNASFINFSLIGPCSAGSSIRKINENGSVECETDDTGLSATPWINDSSVTYVDSSFPQNVNFTGNLTLGEKITFTLGEIIDNIVDGFIRITGGLNVVNESGDSKFFVNVTSGDVGIGTTTPQNTLNVIGDGNITGTLYYGTLDGEANLNVNSSEWWLTSEGAKNDVSDILGSEITNDLNWINQTTGNSTYILQVNEGNLNVNSSDFWDGLNTPADITGLVNSQISNLLTINASGSVTWSALTSYPSACSTSQTITTMGDTLVCSEISITESQITDLQTYIINNTAGWIANFTNIYSLNWTNVTITESQISDLTHTTDTNETTRFDDLTGFDCPAGQLVIGVQANGTVLCVTDADAGNSNIFNQVLNTTSNVTFNRINVTDIIRAQDWTNVSITESQISDFQSYILASNEANLNVNSSNFWDALNTPADILGSLINNDLNWINATFGNATYILQSNEGNLNVNNSNSTDFWDNLDSPSDINAADITDDNTYLLATGDTATGNYTFDSGTLFVDSDNNKVGIGTTTPTTELEVVGDITSKGTKWTSRTTPVDSNWDEVVYGNGLFVAVGSTGNTSVMTSSDGINWINRTSAADNAWRGLTYGNGLFVAVASSGTAGNRVMTSPDGITWTLRSTPVDNNWDSVTYGNGLFVAVATTGTNRVMTSSDGINWTTTSAPALGWVSVTYGNDLFVATSIDGAGNQVMTSSNGINWTLRSSPTGGQWRGITYGNGLFVAVGDNGTSNRVMTSPNGINWTSRTSAADNAWNSVTYGNGLFVAVSLSGTGNRVMTSPDGINWTNRTSAADSVWLDVTYGNGLFVAVSQDNAGNQVMTSGKPEANVVPTNNIFQGGLDVRGDLNVSGTSYLGDVILTSDNITVNNLIPKDGEVVNIEGNLTLGEKIVFALGGFIQNIVSGRVDVNGSLNVTGGVSINDGLNVSGAVSITPAAPSMVGGVTDGTYLAGVRGIVISGNHLYSVGVAGTFPFSVFDITDPENPERVGSITSQFFQASHLDVYGDYAVVSDDLNLSVVDVSNPRNPVRVSTIAVNPNVVRISGKYVYVTTSGTIFQIYDISDPKNIVEVGSVSDSGLSSSSGFDIEGNYAYIAARNTDSLQVVDISDPTNPVIVGNLTDSVNIDEAFDVNVVGRYAYVIARNSDSFAIIDVIDPTAPVLIGSVIDTVNLTDPRRVAIVGDYAYISNYAGKSVQVYDVSNKSSPVKVSDLVDATNLDGAYYVIPYGRHVYVSAQISNRLNVIDIRGLDVSSSNIGSLRAGEVYVVGDGNVGNDLHVGGSLSVGPKGITSQGPVIFDNNTLSTDNGTVVVIGDLNVTGTSYLGDVILTSDNITVNGIVSKDGNISFYNNTGAELVRIDNTGRVGIGTTSPIYKLDVDGSVKASDTYVFSDGSTQLYGSTPDGTGWHVTTASFKQNFSVSSQDTIPRDVFFKPDGKKMYIVGDSGNAVYEYNLSTAWDINTSSFNQNFSVSDQETTPLGLFFRQDGLKMYVAGNQADEINEYTLSTAWSVSTAAFNQVLNVSGEDSSPQAISFKPDGLKMYMLGVGGTDVTEYDLTTPWDINTSSPTGVFSVSGEESLPSGIMFKPDGTKMYIIGSSGDEVNEYDLSTLWDVTTAAAVRVFDVSGIEGASAGLYLKPDGTKMYLTGTGGDAVYEYDLGIIIEGNVGIGTTNPQAPLHINISTNGTVLRLQDADGTCNQNPEAGSLAISCSSDEKLKENIRETESALEEFEDIEIKDYTVKKSGKETTGVIAQEIQETHPELVHEEEGELFVEQPNPWKLLKAIQELKEMIESLIGGNYSVDSTPAFNEDSVGQATILLNSTSVRVEFSEEYSTEPIITVTPIGLPNFFYGIDNITAIGFNIKISEAQDKEIVFNWHAFARPVEEIDVNLTNITEMNITNGTVLGNETIEINDTITNETIEDINETADEGNETIEPIKEIPELNETIGENNKSEEEINQTVVINETENIEIVENLTDSNESVEGIGDNTSVEETSVQQERSQYPIGGSLITGGIIGINEEQRGEQGIFSRLFGMILNLMEGTRDE